METEELAQDQEEELPEDDDCRHSLDLTKGHDYSAAHRHGDERCGGAGTASKRRQARSSHPRDLGREASLALAPVSWRG